LLLKISIYRQEWMCLIYVYVIGLKLRVEWEFTCEFKVDSLFYMYEYISLKITFTHISCITVILSFTWSKQEILLITCLSSNIISSHLQISVRGDWGGGSCFKRIYFSQKIWSCFDYSCVLIILEVSVMSLWSRFMPWSSLPFV
jgi:hypothetical protein